MRNLYILFGFAGLAALSSCTDHEVIPPPVPLVDLNCECEADIGDSTATVTYTDSCYYQSFKSIVTEGVSNARYMTSVEDEDVPGGLEIEIRSINWTDDGTNNPSLEEWKTFLNDNANPNYSDNAGHMGVAVRWIDPNGQTWASDTTASICLESFVFNTLIQESDTTGKYMQFDATFNCTLLNSSYGTPDSLKCLENGHVRSAFKLE
ncbi:MAG: hypothetical protein ACI8ZM_000836 [Crocinitomix sp.]|jgi:hypothetical protein